MVGWRAAPSATIFNSGLGYGYANAAARRPYLQIQQLQLARHLRRNAFGVIISAADRRDVRRRETRGRRDEIVVGEDAVGPIESDPARAG